MIERVLIQNFQQHRKRAFDLSKITCFIGETGSGKSTILRAIRWVATNTPGGDGVVRWGAPGAYVRLVVDGRTVGRRRGKGVNQYTLDDKEYVAFGRGVPDEVRDFLQLSPVWFQHQLGGAFWFSESAGEVSRQLNAIVNLGEIDAALKHVNTQVTRTRAAADANAAALTKAKATYDETKWAVAASEAWGRVWALHQMAEEGRSHATTIRAELKRARAARATARTARVVAQAAATATERGNMANQARGRAVALRAALAACRPVVHPPPFDGMTRAYRAFRTVQNRVWELREVLSDAKQTQEALCRARKHAEKAKAAVPVRCPTCGR